MGGIARVTSCNTPGCDRAHCARGLCAACYAAAKRRGELPPKSGPLLRYPDNPCRVPGCVDRHSARGYCRLHYTRLLAGTLEWDRPRRKMGCGSSSRGYVQVYRPGHPNATKNGMILQHRLVMSEHLCRPLSVHENVHHINGNRADNRIENLELWNTSQPSGQRVEDKVAWAIELLKLYRPDLLGGTSRLGSE